MMLYAGNFYFPVFLPWKYLKYVWLYYDHRLNKAISYSGFVKRCIANDFTVEIIRFIVTRQYMVKWLSQQHEWLIEAEIGID